MQVPKNHGGCILAIAWTQARCKYKKVKQKIRTPYFQNLGTRPLNMSCLILHIHELEASYKNLLQPKLKKKTIVGLITNEAHNEMNSTVFFYFPFFNVIDSIIAGTPIGVIFVSFR